MYSETECISGLRDLLVSEFGEWYTVVQTIYIRIRANSANEDGRTNVIGGVNGMAE